MVIALAGMAIFVGLETLLNNESQLHGILIMMSGGLVFALNGLLAHHKARDLDECALAAWVVAFGAVLLAVAAVVQEAGQVSMPPAHVVASVVAEGLLGMGFASLVYYVLLARAGPYFTSFYAFLVPLLGVLLAAVVLDEPLSPEHLAGLATVLLGLWLLSSSGSARSVALAEKTPQSRVD